MIPGTGTRDASGWSLC